MKDDKTCLECTTANPIDAVTCAGCGGASFPTTTDEPTEPVIGTVIEVMHVDVAAVIAQPPIGEVEIDPNAPPGNHDGDEPELPPTTVESPQAKRGSSKKGGAK